MVSAVFSSREKATWLAIVFLCQVTTIIIVVAASDSSPIPLEREALLQTGWWSSKYAKANNTSDHCNWVGISCNSAGSIISIDLQLRDIEGKLGQFNFSAFPNLEGLYLAFNYLNGSFPTQIDALSNLKYLDLAGNKITGSIPPEIGSLRNLKTLDLSRNRLSGPIPLTLGNLTKLAHLQLCCNMLDGQIPTTIFDLKHLTSLILESNQLEDVVPQQVVNLENLTVLFLNNNKLTGHLPSTFGHLRNLRRLNLYSNQLNGSIPPEIGNMKSLIHLDLSKNSLSGTIPHELTQLTQINFLKLSSNLLSGQIPITIGGLYNLEELDLSNNKLSGPIPTQLTHCSMLWTLKLSNNSLSGNIPTEIGKLGSLSSLDLTNNMINGTIPSQLGEFQSLAHLYLSHNNLSGTIPLSLDSIQDIDLSYNNLEGQIPFDMQHRHSPYNFIGNKGLCGQVLYGYPSCNRLTPATTSRLEDEKLKKMVIRFIIILLPVTTLLTCLMFGFLFLVNRKTKKDKLKTGSTNYRDVLSVWNYDGKIEFEDIIMATEDFDIKYCIGTGTYGSVYKAQLPNSKVVALKKLHRLETEEQTFMKSFQTEAHILSQIRHRNIVKVFGFCLHRKCMFLVYEYMERGSLFCALRNDDEAVELEWSKRVNIIKGVARALSYMHHNCTPPIIHRDISSNNILLNLELEAFVADFGLARFLQPDSSNRTLLAGTYGYIAPGKELQNAFQTKVTTYNAPCV